jgi:flagellar basal-body rod protein FlgB
MIEAIAPQLERYLDVLAARQKLVASNIANLDTPGYHAQDVDFTAALNDELGTPVRAQEVGGLSTKTDGNNVSIDREAALLADTGLRFNMGSQLMKMEIRALRTAIQEGKNG